MFIFELTTTLLQSLVRLGSSVIPSLAKNVPPAASGALQNIVRVFEGGIKEAAALVPETLSASATGATQNLLIARSESLTPKFLLDTLKDLKGHLPDEHWTILDKLAAGAQEGKINLDDPLIRNSLQGYFTKVQNNSSGTLDMSNVPAALIEESNPGAAAKNTAASPRVFTEDEVRELLRQERLKNQQSPAETNTNTQPEDDTECVLKNLLELINLKITKKNGHAFMFLKWGGPVLRFVGFNIPTPEELPKVVEKYITKNDAFRENLKACIENRTVDTSKMSWFQSFVFSSCKKSLSLLGNHSEAVLEKAPQAAYAMKYASGSIIPRIRKIPLFGRILAILYPFAIDELNTAGEVKERELLGPILERIAKHHAKPKPKSAT